MGSALTGVGRSRARRYDQEQDTRVTFEDVAGIEEAENELVEIVDFLKDPEEVHPPWGNGSQGVLLVGARERARRSWRGPSRGRRGCRSSP